MIAIVMVLVCVSCWSQAVHEDTLVGNLKLEWIRKPIRQVPDTCPLILNPGHRGIHGVAEPFPSKISWFSSREFVVVHPLTYGIAVELYDTAGRAQTSGYYHFVPPLGTVKKVHASQLRRLRNGNVGLWGVSVWGSLMDYSITYSRISPIPLFLELDTMLRVERVVEDTTWSGQTRPASGTSIEQVYPYVWRGYGLVNEAESFEGNACYMMLDTTKKGWNFVLYSEDLSNKLIVRRYGLPFSVPTRDSVNRDTTYWLTMLPFCVQGSPLGIVARSRTRDKRRVLVFFGGENFEDLRGLRLPDGDVDLEYIVGDGYVIDAAMRGNQFVLSKVWLNGFVEWERYPASQVVAGARTPLSPSTYYRLKRSRWGGYYLVARAYDLGLTYVARLNDAGRVTGYYRIEVQSRWNDTPNYALIDVVEHYADSSFYVVATYDTALALMKFRMYPSDTTGIDIVKDTTLAVEENEGSYVLAVSPHPIRTGEDLVVSLPEGFDRGKTQAVLYGITGRMMGEYRFADSGRILRIPVQVPPGVYVLSVESQERRLRRLVVVLE